MTKNIPKLNPPRHNQTHKLTTMIPAQQSHTFFDIGIIKNPCASSTANAPCVSFTVKESLCGAPWQGTLVFAPHREASVCLLRGVASPNVNTTCAIHSMKSPYCEPHANTLSPILDNPCVGLIVTNPCACLLVCLSASLTANRYDPMW